MGLIFNGNGDVIRAVDGSLTVEGIDLGGSTNINAGIATFSGNVNVGGVLTYEDVKNVDSVGIVTAREGIKINADNKSLLIGASGDLRLIHDGSNSFVDDAGTGALRVRGSEVLIQKVSSTENMFRGVADGAVELYHNAVKKFETTADGITVTGHIDLDDAHFLKAGTGDDLWVGHDGSHSYINHNGTGGFFIQSSGGFFVQKYGTTERLINANNDGNVELFYDSAKKIETTSVGVTISGNAFFPDNYGCQFGNAAGSADLVIYHSGSHSYIRDAGTGTLRIEASEVGILSADGSETMAQFVQNGAAYLRYDNSTKLETTNTGASISGLLAVSGSTSQTSTFTGNGVTIAHASGSNIFIGTQVGADGKIALTNNSNLHFWTNNAERVRLTSDGKFLVGTTTSNGFKFKVSDGGGYEFALNPNDSGINSFVNYNRSGGAYVNCKLVQLELFLWSGASPAARIRLDSSGNFSHGNRVGTSLPGTNQPFAVHSPRIEPDGMTSTVSNGVRCNLYVGSNSGWASGDGGMIGLGGSRSGVAAQEAVWGYIQGCRQSGNGWEYAGWVELGTTQWGDYNMKRRLRIFADGQMELTAKSGENTKISVKQGTTQTCVLQHTGSNNMAWSNPSSGSFAFNTGSDYRLKKDEAPISNPLTTLKALKPYQFTWKHSNELGQGFYAHEAQAVLPDVGIVSGTKDAVQAEDETLNDGQWKKGDPIYQNIDYSKLVPLLTAALKEEVDKREALEVRIAALES